MGNLYLHEDFADHPKIVALSDPAFRAHVMGMLYAQRFLTDGYVVPTVAPSTKVVRELVKANLWEPDGDGWRIHDWLDWNLPAVTIKARRAADRERARKHRRRGDEGGSS